jgi:farnesyl-diphosphate farnesyltransferase
LTFLKNIRLLHGFVFRWRGAERMDLCGDALAILKQTSRTFYIPISRLPLGLQEAVASAYLCMRAIDEIEDHPDLSNAIKVKLLQTISLSLQAAVDGRVPDDLSVALSRDRSQLAEVSIRIAEWAQLAPAAIAWLTGLLATGKLIQRRIWIATRLEWLVQWDCYFLTYGLGTMEPKPTVHMRSGLVGAYKPLTSYGTIMKT